ncbi:hypothetical protein [Pseudoxanthomonas sp. CF125]|jgi:hypothetical protein|uniref:DUF7710 domain-containing protein n=1 Tax=Pseudoxanthomonas sp. CF125 TaxID=1855303 RepID=UPI00087EF29E|nr:hypothetical protein [Pseudoxanthomonas sp. CF125]SDR07998.1 hypothetical protein SAMN05216569_2980 [Pseudoxanthomonas sp. CF125]
MKEVWVFNGAEGRFPSAVFEERADAESWIKRNALTGVLTKYPIGVSVYEWAIKEGHFCVKNQQEKSATFIQNFSSAAQEHLHFENGSCD